MFTDQDDDEDAPELTFTTSVQDQDRRTSRRHAIVLLIGKVTRGDRESICLVHDISRFGLMARFTALPSVGETLSVEVRGLARIDAVVRWVDGFRAGVEFASPQDVDHVFKPKDADGLTVRSPRFPIRAAVRVRLGSDMVAAELLDISPGGVKLSSATPVEHGQAGQLVLTELGIAVYGAVCWTRGDRFGFRFVAPLSLATLSRILDC